MTIVSVRDNVAETYNSLVLFENEASAIRAFYALADEPTYKDYTLWKMGEYDPKTGEIELDRKRLAEAEA